jgi:hypothetical protein
MNYAEFISEKKNEYEITLPNGKQEIVKLGDLKTTSTQTDDGYMTYRYEKYGVYVRIPIFPDRMHGVYCMTYKDSLIEFDKEFK